RRSVCSCLWRRLGGQIGWGKCASPSTRVRQAEADRQSDLEPALHGPPRASRNLYPAAGGGATPPARMPTGPDAPHAAEAGWMTRLGDACLRALAVVALASVPTALRTSGAGGGFVEGLLVGMGVLLPVVLVALLLSRAAGRGFRQLVGAAS